MLGFCFYSLKILCCSVVCFHGDGYEHSGADVNIFSSSLVLPLFLLFFFCQVQISPGVLWIFFSCSFFLSSFLLPILLS